MYLIRYKNGSGIVKESVPDEIKEYFDNGNLAYECDGFYADRFNLDYSNLEWDSREGTTRGGSSYVCFQGDIVIKASQVDDNNDYYLDSLFEPLAETVGIALGLNMARCRCDFALIDNYVSPVCISDNFAKKDNPKHSLAFNIREKRVESANELHGRGALWQDYLDKVLLLDIIMGNCDRHRKNIEIYDDNTPTPVFDTGTCMFSPDEVTSRNFHRLNPVTIDDILEFKWLRDYHIEKWLALWKPKVKLNKFDSYAAVLGLPLCLRKVCAEALDERVNWLFANGFLRRI
ncbi:hypothetical protein FACS1894188_12630 [Clostridia bacterium]|nr:hypothetical protein FACS1894188_12630 [Clostridia bacterium]